MPTSPEDSTGTSTSAEAAEAATERRVLASHPRRPRHPRRAAALIAAFCLTLTGLATTAAARVDESSEQRLLDVQTKQAAAVLSTAIRLIQEPLSTALSIQRVADVRDETAAFSRLMTAYVGEGRQFTSASLWKLDNDSMTRLVSIGAPPALKANQPATLEYLRSSIDSPTFTVESVSAGDQDRIAYAVGDAVTDYVVYAERAIPADRRAPVDRESAFAALDYAIYLGPTKNLQTLSTTNVDPSTLPLSGTTAEVAVPFGDTVLTMVTEPRGHLGSPLGARLPALLLIGGLLISGFATRTGYQLVRRRQEAEASTATITDLYEQVESLYGQEHELSERLQRALLPHANPVIPHLQIASEYVAGAHGVDIGGDWYSMIALGEDRFGFVVGDVSGRGIDSVAVMAHARFTLRAYLWNGDSPSDALEKCSHQFDIAVDGHLTTAIVGVGNWRTGEVTIASAGHPAPLLITDGTLEYVEVRPGRPLGVGVSTYECTTFTMEPGSTLFNFTDGLVERRTEDIDTGLARLASTVGTVVEKSVDDLVAHAVHTLRCEDASDDIAVLALRWQPSSEARFHGDQRAPAGARSFVADQLPALVGTDGGPLCDDVVLIVSELVTNAVRAGAGTVDVQLQSTPGRLDLRVSDDATGWPTPRGASAADPDGRGLAIVELLTDRWDAVPRNPGKTVTATWFC